MSNEFDICKLTDEKNLMLANKLEEIQEKDKDKTILHSFGAIFYYIKSIEQKIISFQNSNSEIENLEFNIQKYIYTNILSETLLSLNIYIYKLYQQIQLY